MGMISRLSRVVAILLLSAAMLADHALPAPASQLMSSSPVRSPAGANVTLSANLLEQSFASNGRQGFFIEQDGNPASSMSLYDTAWWLEILASRRGLSSPEIRSWAAPLLYGSGTNPGTAGGLPELERLSLAAMLYHDFGWTVDRRRLEARLSKLRIGGEYRSGTGAARGDWGDTSVAIALMRKLNVVPPSVISSALVREGTRILQRSSDEPPGTAIAVLSALSTSFVRSHATSIRSELSRLQHAVQTSNPAARLASIAQLRRVSATVSDRSWAGQNDCRGLLVSRMGASLQGGEAPDPHLTYDALQVGCLSSVEIPPWTPFGWPGVQAISTAVAASTDGMQVARIDQISSRFRDEIRSEFLQVILPAYQSHHPSMSELAQLLPLAQFVNVRIALPPRYEVTLRSAIATNNVSEVPLLSDSLLSGLTPKLSKSDVARIKASRPVDVKSGWVNSPSGIFTRALDDELRYKFTHVGSLRQAARSIVSRLLLRRGLALPRGQHLPSLTLTVVRSWVMGYHLTIANLIAGGLCTRWLTCHDNENGHTVGTPALQVIAALARIDKGLPPYLL